MVNASKIQHHMDVVGSDGQHVGTVDHMDGQMIKLTKDDPTAHGQHHYIPLSATSDIQGNTVRLNMTGQQARQAWRTSASASSAS
jgi:hypothetical protein